MYCLLLFSHDLWDELAPLSPLWKMVSIQLLVMFTFWQSVVIGILGQHGAIRATEMHTEAQLQTQDFVVCLEMAALAVAHHFVWGAKDFKAGSSVLECAFKPEEVAAAEAASASEPAGSSSPLHFSSASAPRATAAAVLAASEPPPDTEGVAV